MLIAYFDCLMIDTSYSRLPGVDPTHLVIGRGARPLPPFSEPRLQLARYLNPTHQPRLPKVTSRI